MCVVVVGVWGRGGLRLFDMMFAVITLVSMSVSLWQSYSRALARTHAHNFTPRPLHRGPAVDERHDECETGGGEPLHGRSE